MPRPKKAIVEYYPHYVNSGKSLFAIENRFGNDGYAFWFKLLEMLGSSEHHFLDCNELNNWEYLLAITKLKESEAKEVLELLSKIGCINKGLWKSKIIRSDNFIKNLDAVYKRREVNVISNTEVRRLCKQKPPLDGIDDDINPPVDGIDDDISTQRRVKESKEKESTALLGVSEFSESMQEMLHGWLCYKKHKYVEIGWKSFKTILSKAITTHGEEAIIDRFNQAMAGDWKGLNFDKMEKVEKASDDWELPLDQIHPDMRIQQK